jgi:hypothetical protein
LSRYKGTHKFGFLLMGLFCIKNVHLLKIKVVYRAYSAKFVIVR